MPRVPVPPEVAEVLARPNPAVVATVAPNGTPHSAATWYAWVDGRVLLNMDEGRRRLDYLRANPAVALTVFDGENWYHHISLLGKVVSIEEDVDLKDIDRLSISYIGEPYNNRERKRYTAWMEPERWHSWPLAK